MSGNDERKILDVPECPDCGERPKFWVLGKKGNIRMCQVLSKRYSLVGLRGFGMAGDTISFYTGYYCVADVEPWAVYAWCKKCGTIIRDEVFINYLINAAKQLEKIKYVDNDEREG